MKVMLKIKLVMHRTTLLATKIFSYHNIKICRDHTKATSVIKAKHDVCLFFCIPENIQKNLTWFEITNY